MRGLFFIVGIFILFTGCGGHMHPYADYLDQSVGREGHDAIANKMGEPYRTGKLDAGDVWSYEYCPSGSSHCQHVNLIFDKSGTLSEWFEN